MSFNRRQLIASALLGLAFRPALAQSSTGPTSFVGGLDSRDPEAPGNTDVMLLVRVDEDARKVRALFIPRDLYVEIPGHGWNKINQAFPIGAGGGASQSWDAGIGLVYATFKSAFGVEAGNGATIDFAGFPRVVDAVGGIDVDNPYVLYETDGTTVQFPEGEIHLDGPDALRYVRHRHQDGDDGRVMRQQLVLDAILAKARAEQLGYEEFIDLALTVGTTDLGPREMLDLFRLAADIDEEDITFGTIEDQLTPGETASGEWIYEADWSTLPGYVQDWLDGR